MPACWGHQEENVHELGFLIAATVAGTSGITLWSLFGVSDSEAKPEANITSISLERRNIEWKISFHAMELERYRQQAPFG
ncbi:protein COFACTOR ASSEMBLY OF COMPLEX C SUBUNIT B CCB1, chloroplastic-like [Gossypium australe]|uniref:Protein COFACTOR ASSEMBLY OF COMPLEX C SUBUNIT B CCB1, chloroplastic-like n=1 Tax=Gossypium australe TaxID=47621 RepID=A0A5B6W2L6_9ROSI|nr:protein COFACTOR ASSEMBLY OF COMPLEX C SUBUNIT B CCB1, chloroplastic-like [Gossypium australe]